MSDTLADSGTRLVVVDVEESNGGTGGSDRGDRAEDVAFDGSVRDCVGDSEGNDFVSINGESMVVGMGVGKSQ